MLPPPSRTESLCCPSNCGMAQADGKRASCTFLKLSCSISPPQERVSSRTIALLDNERRRKDTLLSGSNGRKQDIEENQ